MRTFFQKPKYVLLLFMMTLLLSRIQAQVNDNGFETRTSTFDALFKFETVRGTGNMTTDEIQNWSDASSEFFAAMFDQLNDNITTPMWGPGVIITVTQQDRYVAGEGNFGSIFYGVSLEVNFLVTFQTPPTEPQINAGNRVFRIFDRDDKGNLIFFSPYLLALRRSVGNTFLSVNKMSININGPRPVDLQSPIPTLPLPPPTDEPTIAPTIRPTTNMPTAPPTVYTRPPTLLPAKTPSPTIMYTPLPYTPLPTNSPTTPLPTPMPTTEMPTMAPVTANPTAPDETYAPTVEPDPTNAPTKLPTAPPTLPLESFFATSKLILEGLTTNLNFNATQDFQEVTSTYLSTIIQDLLKDTIVEDVTVGLSSQTVVKPKSTSSSAANGGGGTRRQLERRRQLQQQQQQDDEEDEEPSKLLVEFNTILKIRSLVSVNAPSLVQSAFGTAGRRENYRLLLVETQDPILEQITLVQLDGAATSGNGGNRNAVPPANGGLSTAALVGIAVGATIFAIAILGIWYKANNNNSGANNKQDEGDSQKGQIPTAHIDSEAMESHRNHRLDAEIVVDKNADDVSTLGDPFFGMSLEERTCADKTATSASVQQSYDFMKLMAAGKSGTNTNNGTLLGTTAEDEEFTTASKIKRNTLFADDDASFEDMFGEMK